MAKYIWDPVTALTPFVGFTTNYLIAGCSSKSLPWAGVSEGGTATKVGFFKVLMKPTTLPFTFQCAGTSQKIKATAVGALPLTFLEFIDAVRPTAYTAAKKVYGVSAFAGNGGTATKCRFWLDAYDSAGLRVATTLCGTALGPAIAPAGFQLTMPATTSTLAKAVTVPVGGYLGWRIHPNANGTVRLYGGSGWAGTNGAMVLNTIEVAAGPAGASVENRERFHFSNGNPMPDGTKVYEYNATTMAYTGTVGFIGEATGPGVSVGAPSLFVAGTTGITAVTIDTTSRKSVAADGAYTFTVAANLANFDLVLTSPNAVVQTIPSVNLTATGLICNDTGLVFSFAGVPAAGIGGSFTISGAGVGTDAALATAATGVGEVVFTRATADAGEYFYIVPDPASGVAWTATAVLPLAHKINPLSLAKLYAEVTTAGTTGAVEPAWDTLALIKGSTVVDGTVTWTMVEVETICTNAVQGYQLGNWTTGMTAVIAAVGPPAVAATIVAPSNAAANQHAICTVAGTAGVTQPVWTGLAAGATVVDGTVTWTIVADQVYD